MNEREQKIKAATQEAHDKIGYLDEKVAGQLLDLYKKARDDIEADIRKAADQDGQIDPRNLQDLQKQINIRLDSLTTVRDAYLLKTLNHAAELGLSPWRGILLEDFLVNLADEAVSFTIHFHAADGLQLSDRLWRLDTGAIEAIGSQIRQSIAQGLDISRSVREFLAKGETVPAEVLDRLKGIGADAVAKKAGAELLTDESGAYWKAKRVFRTELNRAHGSAYIAAVRNYPDSAGLKFLLSPNHPRPDICDFYSRANLYGLGPGVYPFDLSPWPAHPNTLSFVVVVFRSEVLPEHATPDNPIEWMKAQSPEWQDSVLGKKKAALLRSGDLGADEITTPLRWLRNVNSAV